MATKCTKLEVAWKRCPAIVFRGHDSNFKVTRAVQLKILTWSKDFRAIIGFADGYKMMHKAWSGIEKVPCFVFLGHPWNFKDSYLEHGRGSFYCFSMSSVKFQGHTGCKIDLDLIWARLQGRLDLSNLSDLLCYDKNILPDTESIHRYQAINKLEWKFRIIYV